MSCSFSRIIISFSICLLVASQGAMAQYEVKRYSDIPWAAPKGYQLTADILVPQSENFQKSRNADKNRQQDYPQSLPVLVIFHGGGWLLNNKEIMDDLAVTIASHANIITVNVNYRRLGDVNNTTTANEIVEDAMGAVLWVKDVIAEYGGDPGRVAVTGDSAGGHLAAMVLLAGRQLSEQRFNPQSQGFKPSYLPKGQTAEQVASNDGLKLQAAILSYAGFSLEAAARSGFETAANPFWGWADAKPRGLFGEGVTVDNRVAFYQAVSPENFIVERDSYALPPQFVLVGSEDRMTPPESAREYVNKLKQARQKVQFKIYPGKGHGFLDSGCHDYTGGCFKDLSKPAVGDMVEFLIRTLHPPG